MAQSLTEERKVAWRIRGIGPDPKHQLVIFRKISQGKVLYKILDPGQIFKRPFWISANSFEAYVVSADQNLRHDFSRKYQSADLTWAFTLHFKLHFRVKDVKVLGLGLSDQDPVERLQEEVASVLSATARRFSWEKMKKEGEDFGRLLCKGELTDTKGEIKNNFNHLQKFVGDLGLELLRLEVFRSLNDSELDDEKKKRENERQIAKERSDLELATERENSSHKLQSLKDQHKIERETSVARSSQVLHGMERLRLILDAAAEGGVQAIHQSAGELRSFNAIHRALIEIQRIQASLAGLWGGTAPTLAPGTYGEAIEGVASEDVCEPTTCRNSPLESIVAEAFQHLHCMEENPKDQRRILASVLHLVAEAGLGVEADKEFLSELRDDLKRRLQPVRSALPSEPLDFLESILDLERLQQRLS
jgi:hypothetical protein